jgi:mannose-6-phosphate isomerase-like protein (cupin superfamily)
MRFETRRLPSAHDVIAPDGSEVRILLALGRGSMAHFALASGQTSAAVRHRSVEELWYVLSGQGEMWRRTDDPQEAIVVLEPGVSVSIPPGTRFQFRATGTDPLCAVGVTMPPWPGADEAEIVAGPWQPTVR